MYSNKRVPSGLHANETHHGIPLFRRIGRYELIENVLVFQVVQSFAARRQIPGLHKFVLASGNDQLYYHFCFAKGEKTTDLPQ